MIRRVAGVFLVVLGTLQAAWIGYNLLVHMTPQARGRNPLPGLVFVAMLYFVGWRWLKGETAG